MSICPNFYYFQKLKRFFCYSFLYIYILFYICSIDNTILCQSLTIWYVSLSQSYPTVSHPSLNSSPSKSLSLDTSLICPHILTYSTTHITGRYGIESKMTKMDVSEQRLNGFVGRFWRTHPRASFYYSLPVGPTIVEQLHIQ